MEIVVSFKPHEEKLFCGKDAERWIEFSKYRVNLHVPEDLATSHHYQPLQAPGPVLSDLCFARDMLYTAKKPQGAITNL